MKHYFIASAVAVATLAGCAGTVQKPHVYSKYENKGGLGVPAAMVGATGEQRYCAHGLAQQVQERKNKLMQTSPKSAAAKINIRLLMSFLALHTLLRWG